MTDPTNTNPPRLVRRWWDMDYPVITKLTEQYDLIAHPNGPALCDGDILMSIDTHPDDHREMMLLKMKAQAAWKEYAWPLVKDNFYPHDATSMESARNGVESSNMLRAAGYVLQEAVMKLLDSDENIKSATDEELEEAMENGYAPEIRTQAQSVLLARNAVRMTGYLFPQNAELPTDS